MTHLNTVGGDGGGMKGSLAESVTSETKYIFSANFLGEKEDERVIERERSVRLWLARIGVSVGVRKGPRGLNHHV